MDSRAKITMSRDEKNISVRNFRLVTRIEKHLKMVTQAQQLEFCDEGIIPSVKNTMIIPHPEIELKYSYLSKKKNLKY